MFSTTYIFAFPSPGAVRFAAVLEDYLYFVANKRFVAPPIIRRMIGVFDLMRSFALISLILKDLAFEFELFRAVLRLAGNFRLTLRLDCLFVCSFVTY